MSQENVSALRSLYAQFADGKVWAAEELLARDVVSSWPDAGGQVVCHGREELRRRLRELLRYWSRYRVEAQQFDVLTADSVLVVAHQFGEGEMSGIEMESRIYTVWRFGNGRVIAQHWALDRRDALEAAGLAEQAMSEENVNAFRRGVHAMNQGDIDGLLEVIDPDVAWRDAINAIFGGEATMYRGHDAVREVFQDLYGSFAELDADYYDIRDLGDERVLGLGQLRMRGKESGAETESPVAALTEWSNGKAVRVLTYLDHAEALEAAGLSE